MPCVLKSENGRNRKEKKGSISLNNKEKRANLETLSSLPLEQRGPALKRRVPAINDKERSTENGALKGKHRQRTPEDGLATGLPKNTHLESQNLEGGKDNRKYKGSAALAGEFVRRAWDLSKKDLKQ